MERWRQDCEAIRRTKAEADAAKSAAERQLQAAQSQQDVERAEEGLRQATARVRHVATLLEPAAPSTVVEDSELSAEHQMHWRAPRQLMEIFSQLEEQNLFLIQNAQETEVRFLVTLRIGWIGDVSRTLLWIMMGFVFCFLSLLAVFL